MKRHYSLHCAAVWLFVCLILNTQSTHAQVYVPFEQRTNFSPITHFLQVDVEPIHSVYSVSYIDNPYSHIFASIRVGTAAGDSLHQSGFEVGGDLIITLNRQFNGLYFDISMTEIRERVGVGVGYVYPFSGNWYAGLNLIYSVQGEEFAYDINRNGPFMARISIGGGF